MIGPLRNKSYNNKWRCPWEKIEGEKEGEVAMRTQELFTLSLTCTHSYSRLFVPYLVRLDALLFILGLVQHFAAVYEGIYFGHKQQQRCK